MSDIPATLCFASLKERHRTEKFWAHHRGQLRSQDWQRLFASDKAAAYRALAQGDTPGLLVIVLNRMYVLRNQIVHGGATWNSDINRSQLKDCTNFLGKLVPILILLMMNNPDTLWGDVVYPVIKK